MFGSGLTDRPFPRNSGTTGGPPRVSGRLPATAASWGVICARGEPFSAVADKGLQFSALKTFDSPLSARPNCLMPGSQVSGRCHVLKMTAENAKFYGELGYVFGVSEGMNPRASSPTLISSAFPPCPKASVLFTFTSTSSGPRESLRYVPAAEIAPAQPPL